MENSSAVSSHNFEKLHVSVDRDPTVNVTRSRSCLFGCGNKDAEIYIVKSALDSHCWDVRKNRSDFETLETKMIAKLHSQIGMSPSQADRLDTKPLTKDQARKILEQMPQLPPKLSFWSRSPDVDYYRNTSAGLQKYISDTIGISLRGNNKQFSHEISAFLGVAHAVRKATVFSPGRLNTVAKVQQAQLLIEKEAYKERSEELERERAQDTVKEDKNKIQLFQQLSELQDEIEDAKRHINSAIAEQTPDGTAAEASGAPDSVTPVPSESTTVNAPP